jgi:two-component system, NtrC family, sensor histidine kinase PilS
MDPREADRRRGDRRRSDRRTPQGRRREDAFDRRDLDTGSDWLGSHADEHSDSDSRLFDRRARRLEDAQDSAFARVYRTYAAARAAIGVGLVLVQGLLSLSGLRASDTMALVSLAYAVQAITLWLLPRFGALTRPQQGTAQRRRQWLATIGVDLLAFSALHVIGHGGAFNFAALLVLPVLMAGVLTSRLRALGTAAAVALLLLAAAWLLPAGVEGPGLMLQSGLAGLGLFVIAVLAGELAGRLAREELSARGSLELARQQAQLNRLVIEEMADGVLVVDPRLLVRAANPAARALLVDQGLSPPAPFNLDRSPAWSELLVAAAQALAEGRWPEAGQDVTLHFAEGHTRTLRVRVRFMRGRSLGLERPAPQRTEASDSAAADSEPAAVLLLEDLRTLQARIRQDKLAAMGRVSAGIAHEIRNPLAAIAQANALMMEDTLEPAQQRLARMVADNVERLKRLVDDVMELAPGAEPGTRVIDASACIGNAAGEWARTTELPLGDKSRLRAEVSAEPLGVWFDPEHLRRVLVNLLDNAHRHAGAGAGSIFLRLAARDEAWVVLSVLSDGAPIAPDVERRLFEPFFSTRSRGSGLGLYICRELCERHGASIEYRPRPAAERLRNEFIVSLRRAPLHTLHSAAPASPLSTNR